MPPIMPGARTPPPSTPEAEGGPEGFSPEPRPGSAGGRSRLSIPLPPSSVGDCSPPPAADAAAAAAAPCGDRGLLERAAELAPGAAPKGDEGSREGPPEPAGLDPAGPWSHTPSPVPQMPANADGTLAAAPPRTESKPVPRFGSLLSSAARPLSFAARPPAAEGSSSRPMSSRPAGREGRSSSPLVSCMLLLAGGAAAAAGAGCGGPAAAGVLGAPAAAGIPAVRLTGLSPAAVAAAAALAAAEATLPGGGGGPPCCC